MKVLVGGATGLVGGALVDYLTASRTEILRLSRSPAPAGEPTVQWEPSKGVLPAAELEGIDAVVHLAGESIVGRWTGKKKAEILSSRVVGTSLLCETLAGLSQKPKVLVCASAVGYYGSRDDEVCTEQSPSGQGFLAQVAIDWEGATAPAREAGIRVVNLRIGVVLSPSGGALAKMMLPFGLGIGGRVGSGRQFMSWVTLDDLVRIIDHVILHQEIRGPVNAVAPTAVTNQQFTRSLGRAMRRPAFLPAPAFLVKLLLGEMGRALLLSSTRADPAALRDSGYEFVHPTLDDALAELVRGT
ncbi:MAG TPA: TIGR01777 family oxidoreductase [Candidatus Latescibacteria bacterium]|jgi:hypothetical protein|nr:TIGR01777 family oxidoreductase [Candidatus Latescibacterota bacterium]